MAKMMARGLPWRPSPERSTPAQPWRRSRVRVLTDADTAELIALVNRNPAVNVFLASYLETAGTASPTRAGVEIIGVFDSAGALTAACWAGVNVVPAGVEVASRDGELIGEYLGRSGRRFSSIFGPAAGVLPVWSSLRHYSPEPFAVRAEQPFMEATGVPVVAPAPGLRPTLPEELDALLPACVSMFEEEVGYSPYSGGDQYYGQRVKSLIAQGHSLVDMDSLGRVKFKAEFGTVSTRVVQIQGVWMNHRYRGQGLSASYMAAVALLAAQTASTVSLYVNSYNERAIAAYRKAGFEQTDTFATVLF